MYRYNLILEGDKMTILLKYILKNIKEKKIRSSLIIISLTVSVVVLTFCLMLKDNILVKYEEFLRKNIGTADISISKEENIDILELNKLSNEKYISAPFLFYQDNKKYIYGANVEDIQKIKILKSNLVTNLNDDETIISSKLAQKNNIKKGEKIELLGKEYKVVDIVEEYGFFIVNDKELEVYMLSINEVNRIINTNNYNLALDKERTYVNSAFIDVLDDDIENAKKDLHAIDENFDISVVKIDVEQAANEMNYLMFIMLVITTLIAVYIINSILSLILQ